MSESTPAQQDKELEAGVRVVALHLPEDEGEGLGFTLTRTMWDPYPWVREVTALGRAAVAGLQPGDCILQADGRDLLGMPVGQVAGLIRGDGASHGVSLLVWSCGTSPQEDPELLWSAGGGARGERSRRALSGVLRALACAVCSATAQRAAQCARGHLYCAGCRARLQRCALCREPMPPLDAPQARNLVAEQVFEAIASAYDLKDTLKTASSASSSPNRSPVPQRTPAYQISMLQKNSRLRKTVQFENQNHYSSDSSLNRPPRTWVPGSDINHPLRNSSDCVLPDHERLSAQKGNNISQSSHVTVASQTDFSNSEHTEKSDTPVSTFCNSEQTNKSDSSVSTCQTHECCHSKIPACQKGSNMMFAPNMPVFGLQHKLVARLRPACSLADLNKAGIQTEEGLSRSLNNIHVGQYCGDHVHSMEELHSKRASCQSLDGCHGSCQTGGESPMYVLSSAPLLLVSCDHNLAAGPHQ